MNLRMCRAMEMIHAEYRLVACHHTILDLLTNFIKRVAFIHSGLCTYIDEFVKLLKVHCVLHFLWIFISALEHGENKVKTK